MSGKLLIVITSGWDSLERARQGLRIARNLARGRMVEELGILFVGPGVTLLDTSVDNYSLIRKFLKELREYGVLPKVCHGNLKVYGLENKFDRQLVVTDDAATVVAEYIRRGFAIATF